MSLIDDLRQVAPHVPPSHVPTLAELPGVLGAFIAYVEHGDNVIEAAAGGFDDVAALFAAPPAPPAPAEPETTVAAPEPVDDGQQPATNGVTV